MPKIKYQHKTADQTIPINGKSNSPLTQGLSDSLQSRSALPVKLMGAAITMFSDCILTRFLVVNICHLEW
jgi:hypothetical protein